MKDRYSVTISSRIRSWHFHVRRTVLRYVIAAVSCVFLVIVTSGAANYLQWDRISTLTKIKTKLDADLEAQERLASELKQSLQGYDTQARDVNSELVRIEESHGVEQGELMFSLEERVRMIGDLVMRYKRQADDIYDELAQVESINGTDSEGTTLTVPERVELVGHIMARYQKTMDDLYAELNQVEEKIEVHNAEGVLTPEERVRRIGQTTVHYVEQSKALHNELDFIRKRSDTDTGDATLALEERMRMVSGAIDRYYNQSELLHMELDNITRNGETDTADSRAALEHRMLLLGQSIDRYYNQSESLRRELDHMDRKGDGVAGNAALAIEDRMRMVSESIDRYYTQSEALHDELDHMSRNSSTHTGVRSQSLEDRIRMVSQWMESYYSERMELRDELVKIEQLSEIDIQDSSPEPDQRVRKIGEILFDYAAQAKDIRNELDRVESLNGKVVDEGQLDVRERIDQLGRSIVSYRDQLTQVDRELNRIAKRGELPVHDEALEDRLHSISNFYDQKEAFFVAVQAQLEAIEEIINPLETQNWSTSSDIEKRLIEISLTAGQQRALHDNAPSGYPMQRVTITSGYGMRLHPVTRIRAFHRGVDIRAPIGEEVFVTADGVVNSVGSSKNYGKLIRVTHNYGFKTVYAHLSKMLVEPGDFVYKGDIIGYTGNSGRSNGPHLHYEVLYLGKSLDPNHFLDWGLGNNEIFTQVDNVKWQSLLNQINKQITQPTLQLSQREQTSPER